MKMLFSLVVMTLSAALSASPAFATAPDTSGDGEPDIKRIFIRDGEVIEIAGDDQIEWNLGTRTYLGVSAIDISDDLREHFGAPEDRGVLISKIGNDTPAESAGLVAGDLIVSVGGEPVSSTRDLRRLIRRHESNEAVEIGIVRSGVSQKVQAILGERELELPRIHLRGNDDAFSYRIDDSEGSLKKLRELFESEAWNERVMKLRDCSAMEKKIETMQKRLEKMEKRLKSLE
ncbi:MAG: PDZ domain-containing protein [Thermoanaerobaculia bacterium]|nr:PDZ domain-containing protein [Thermoanaerobaculia bacterium]